MGKAKQLSDEVEKLRAQFEMQAEIIQNKDDELQKNMIM